MTNADKALDGWEEAKSWLHRQLERQAILVLSLAAAVLPGFFWALLAERRQATAAEGQR